MPEWPDDVLAGVDRPRPLPLALRRRLSDVLLDATARGADPRAGLRIEPDAPARPLGDDLSARLEDELLDDELSDPLVGVFAGVDAPRPLPAGARRTLNRNLSAPRRVALGPVAAAAAALVVLAGVGVGLAESGGTGSTAGSSPSQAIGPPRAAHGGTSARAPGPSNGTSPGRFDQAAPGSVNQSATGTAPAAGSSATGSAAAAPSKTGPVPAAAPVPPDVTAISPASGPVSGGTWVTLTGTGFSSAATVRFGSLAAVTLVVVSPTEIQAEAPAQPLGVVDVVVGGPGGTSAVGPADRFTYTG